MVFFINNTKILFKHSDKNRSLKIDGFKKILLITTITIVSAFLVMYALFQISKSRTYQFFGVLVNRVETTEKVVALTFDDAPTEYSDEVLETLSDKDIKATFYVIGRNIETIPMKLEEL